MIPVPPPRLAQVRHYARKSGNHYRRHCYRHTYRDTYSYAYSYAERNACSRSRLP